MRLVLLGPPGAGKGTHAQILSKNYGIAHISTGDMLRDSIRAGVPLGLKAKEYMDGGSLVPDDLVIALVAERLKQDDAKIGFILDGFPRTAAQAHSLDASLHQLKMPLDLILYFKTSLQTVIRRLSGRRICGKCGKSYHVTNFKPLKEGVCDICGDKLILRSDDREEAIVHRMEVYEAQTAPLISYYENKKALAEVSGDLDVEPLQTTLKEIFEKRVSKKIS